MDRQREKFLRRITTIDCFDAIKDSQFEMWREKALKKAPQAIFSDF
jgi:hypothetical protein